MGKQAKKIELQFSGEVESRRNALLLQDRLRRQGEPALMPREGREATIPWLVANRRYHLADERARKEGLGADDLSLHVLEAVEPLAKRAPHDRSKDAASADTLLHIANAYLLGGFREDAVPFADRYYRVKMHEGVTPLQIANAREAAALAAKIHLEKTAEQDAAKAAIAARLELGEEIHPLMAKHNVGREDASPLIESAFHAHLAAGRRGLALAVIKKNPRVWKGGDVALKENGLV